MDRPKLRDVEPFPADGDRFYLRDPRRISDTVLLVPRAALYVISLFDGNRSVVDIQAEYARQSGEVLSREKLDEIIAALDEALFLDNERFARAQAGIIRAFHESDVRGPINAGLSYPGEARELKSYLGGFFVDEAQAVGSRDAGDRGDGAPLEAIVAPHIDLGRGRASYAAIYRRLARRSTASRFVILGICHHPTQHAFALTRKDYDTPLGRVRTDRDFVDRVASECETDFLVDEIAHRDEHSIEFQILFLRYLFGGYSSLCAGRDIRVVPILCSSFHGYLERGEPPAASGEAAEFLGVLGRLLGERKDDCLIAAVDFAHLGRQFGQDLTVGDELLRNAEADDRRMMERIADRDAEGFFRMISEERDRRNVCGVPALYSMLHILGPGPTAEVARYDQAVDRKNDSVVTFGGIGFSRAGEAERWQ